MKLSISTVLIASVFRLVSANDSSDEAIILRERALLRPAWRPTTPTVTEQKVVERANIPLRRGRRAEESKIAFRHHSHRQHTNARLNKNTDGNAEENPASTITAVPIHINYVADNMPFPLAMQLQNQRYEAVNHRQVKRDASAQEQDADEEDDFDCEEWEDEEDQTTAVESYAQSTPEQAWSSEAAPSPSSSSVWEQPSQPAPSSKTSSFEAPSSEAPPSSPSAQPVPTSTEASTEWWLQSATSQAASDVAPSPAAPSSSSEAPKQTATILRNATGVTSVQPPTLRDGSLTTDNGCTRFHTVVQGEICLGLLDWSRDINLTLEQLYEYNPTINSDCTNLAIGQSVCIGKK